MAKRKRAINQTTSRKRAKEDPQLPHPHGEYDPEREYQLKSIVGEDKFCYLISWEDDEQTGQSYQDTWEPKKNANREAIHDWKVQKAQKKRLERQAGRPSNSRSNSVQSIPKAGSPNKPSTPTRPAARLRLRKVVDSSPPTQGANGLEEGALETTEEQLEIVESPQHSQEANQETNLDSPLFVPEDETDIPSSPPKTAAVHLSAPPSSYLEGDYQHVVSSELASSASGPGKKSPEPSPYITDPVDTSKSTVETSEVSLAPTTPFEQPRAVAVDFGSSSVKVVPDSQSARASSSYVPIATGVSSHSTPAPRVKSSTGQALVAAPEIGESAQFAGPHQASSQFVAAGFRHPSQHSELVAKNGDLQDLPNQSFQQSPARSFPDTAAQANSSSGQPLDFNRLAAQNCSRLEDSTLSQTEQESPTKSPEHPVVARDTLEAASKAHSDQQSTGFSGHPRSHPIAQTQAKALLPTGSNLPASQTSTELHRQSLSKRTPGTAKRAAQATYVDLTADTQAQPTSIGGLSITPPRRGAFLDQPVARSRPPASSTYLSSFPFQTQIERPRSSGLPAHSNNQRFQFQQTASASANTAAPNFEDSLRAISLPPGRSSQFQLSGPIISPPSHSIGIRHFGGSAPLRPQTPPSPVRPPSMDSSQATPKSSDSISSKIKAMRERHRKELADKRGETPTSAPVTQMPEVNPPRDTSSTTAPKVASLVPARLASPFLAPRDGLRSPSVVPAVEPLPDVNQEDVNNSGRYETLLPQAQNNNVRENQRNGSLTAMGSPARMSSPHEGAEIANIHTIPIGLVGHQRDQYPQLIYYYKDIIQQCLNSAVAGPSLLTEASRFLDRLRRITVHPDLDNDEALSQYSDVESSPQVDWHVSCSAKFRFLKEFLELVRDNHLHIALIAQPGQVIDILESFLHGMKIPCYRTYANGNTVESHRSDAVKVTLLAEDEEVPNTVGVDVVFAMDNLIKSNSEQVRALRRKDGEWAPMLRLLIPRSVEHIDDCLSASLSDQARTHTLLSRVFQFKNEAGRLEAGQLSPKAAAETLASYLTKPEHDATWPLAGLSILEDLDSQTESEIDPALNDEDEASTANTGTKRLHEIDEEPIHKRSRLESSAIDPATMNPREMDTTHISDSIEKTTQSNAPDGTLDSASSRLSITEKRLQELVMQTQNRLNEHVQALTDLQYRHEEQRNHWFEATTERDNAIATAQQAITRFTEESNRSSNLRVENSSLKEQLKQANARLLDHSIPELAQYEALRQAVAQSAAGTEKLEKRIADANKDTAYARDQYQNASNTATTLVNENAELGNQLAVAKNRATGEHVKLRQMGYDNYTKNLESENKKLKALVESRDAGLKFRDEEIAKLKEASRGRMGTRGTSVPRSPRAMSPRVGGPTTLDPRVRSRQGSPAIGEVRGRSGLLHPLRNG